LVYRACIWHAARSLDFLQTVRHHARGRRLFSWHYFFCISQRPCPELEHTCIATKHMSPLTTPWNNCAYLGPHNYISVCVCVCVCVCARTCVDRPSCWCRSWASGDAGVVGIVAAAGDLLLMAALWAKGEEELPVLACAPACNVCVCVCVCVCVRVRVCVMEMPCRTYS